MALTMKITVQIQKFGSGYAIYLNDDSGGGVQLQVQHPSLDTCVKFVSDTGGAAIAEGIRKYVERSGGVI